MDIYHKLNLLCEGAKYDVSCSSSGSNRQNQGGVGNGAAGGICHSFTPDGRCISLLKILMTNSCVNDCAYCAIRSSNDVERTIMSPDELATLTMEFYRRNYIEGLFLSSGILKSADYTMELIVRTLEILRRRERFFGYIHAKVIPGASQHLVDRAAMLADRLSVNIELPSSVSLKLIAPQKDAEKVLGPMKHIAKTAQGLSSQKALISSTPDYVRAGQTTQMIIGASPESDHTILQLSEGMYKRYKLKRVYYSAYRPINEDTRLPALVMPSPTVREHRLYQSDWLLRFYGFSAGELLREGENLDLNVDPKISWALNNLDNFPVEVNKAPYETLLRVPGIGVNGARKIVTARRAVVLTFEGLRALKIVLKRARYFILVNGKYYGGLPLRGDALYPILSKQEAYVSQNVSQLSFFGAKEEKLLPGAVAGLLSAPKTGVGEIAW